MNVFNTIFFVYFANFFKKNILNSGTVIGGFNNNNIDLFQTLLYDYNKFSRVEAGTRQTSLLYISGTNHVIVA